MNRRKQGTLFGLIALGLCCVIAGTLIAAQHTAQSLHTKQAQALGTTILIGARGDDAQAALGAAAKEIARLDALFADDGDGDIARLNAEKSITADSDTLALLTRAKEISAETDGLYSCTAAPLLDAWRLALSADRASTESELAPLLAAVDDSQIAISGDTVTIPANVRVNVESIARGYIAERVEKIFSDYSVDSGFINLDIDKARFADGDAGLLEGGGVGTFSKNESGDAWTINVPNPVDSDRVIATYDTYNKGVFNAGLYQETVETNGRSHRLIIDPRTGQPAESGLASVSVVSEDSTLAAALAEALYVMGRAEGLDYWDDHRINFDAIFIDNTGSTTPTGRDITITAGIYQNDGSSFRLVEDPGGNEPLTKSTDERATRVV